MVFCGNSCFPLYSVLESRGYPIWHLADGEICNGRRCAMCAFCTHEDCSSAWGFPQAAAGERLLCIHCRQAQLCHTLDSDHLCWGMQPRSPQWRQVERSHWRREWCGSGLFSQTRAGAMLAAQRTSARASCGRQPCAGRASGLLERGRRLGPPQLVRSAFACLLSHIWWWLFKRIPLP